MKSKNLPFAVLCTGLLLLIGLTVNAARMLGISLWYSPTDSDKTDQIQHQTTSSEQELLAACPDPSAWNMMLVNQSHPISEDYQPNLTTLTLSNGSEKLQFDTRAADALTQMIEAGNAAGMELTIVSTYRTIEYQNDLFNRKIQQYREQGQSEDEAVAVAATVVTPPGCSEHNIGLAADIVGQGYSTLDSGFEDTAAGQWLAAHCAEYGFILRYPADKSDITGIIYEPWHFRYVGKQAAEYITEHQLCLEEFIEQRIQLED